MWKLLRNLVIVAVLCIAVLKLVLWYETRQGAIELVERLAPFAQIRYGGVGSNLDGQVSFSSVSVTIGRGAARQTWRAADVELTTPGTLWIVRRVLLEDESLPERLGITVRGLQPPAQALAAVADSPWLSPLSMVPFETLGCGVVSRFSVADYQRMGLNPGLHEQHFEYRYDAATSVLAFTGRLDNPPFSTLSLQGELQKFDPRMLASPNWRKLHLSELSVGYADSGYLAKRNRFCAQQAGISPRQFVNQHVSAVEAFLNEHGVRPSAEVVATYRSLVADGGRVSVLSLPAAGSTIGDLIEQSPDAMTRRLNLTARRNDAPPVMVRLEFQAPPEVAAAGDTRLAEPGEASPSPTPGTAAPAQPAVAAPAASAVPAPQAASRISTATPPTPSPAPKPAASASTVAAAATPRGKPPTAPAPSGVAAHDRAPAASAAASKPAPPAATAKAPSKVAGAKAPASSALASGPPPPPGSTLALVWKPTVDRLQRAPPPPRDYDVISVDALSRYTGRFVRLITKTQKEVEGRVIGIDKNSVGMRINRAGGTAELQVPRNVIVEVRVPRVPRNDGG